MLLPFGGIPRPARNTLWLTQLERSQAVEKAVEGNKELAKLRIAFVLKRMRGKKGLELLYLRGRPCEKLACPLRQILCLHGRLARVLGRLLLMSDIVHRRAEQSPFIITQLV